jgi:hypothetical protein
MALRPHLRVTAAAAALSLVVPGCATPGQPVTQNVKVETPGCLQVTCEVSNDRGSWQIARTPGAVTLTTSQAPLKVSCRADDGALGNTNMPSAAPASTTGAGAVTGGLIGGAAAGAAFGTVALTFIPALGAVILLTGVAAGALAGQTAESGLRPIRYPDLISIPMYCGPAPTPAQAAAVAALPLGLKISGLPSARARELGLGERGAVLVDTVDAGGRAESAGIRAGDIILAANGDPLGDATDLEERLVKLVSGSALTLRIWRQGQILELVLRRPPVAP